MWKTRVELAEARSWGRRIAVGGIVGGLVLAGWGQTMGTDIEPAPPSEPRTGVTFVEPVHGTKPIDEIIDFWMARTRDNDLDYLSRTELGRALTIQARETGESARYLDAERVLVEALALNPSHQPARLALASVLSAQHRFTDALDLARSAREADPSSLVALALVGDASLDLGDYEAADAAYDELAAADRSAPVLARLARLAWVRGDPDGAVRLSEEAWSAATGTGLRPHSAAHYPFQVGHFRFSAGDVEGSVEALEDALLTAPGHLGTIELLAHVRASAGDLDGAGDLYRRLLERAPAADLHGAYAEVLTLLGDHAGAAEHERLGIDLANRSDVVSAERRHLAGYLATRDPDRAVALAEADMLDRRDVGALDTLAWALHQAGRHDEADEHVTAALDVGTVDASLLYHAGAIRAATGRVDSARDLLSRALSLNPRFDPVDAGHAASLLESLG